MGTHGVVAAAFVGAAWGAFFLPKSDFKLERAEAAVEAVLVAVFAAFCAAAEFVALATELMVPAGPQAGAEPAAIMGFAPPKKPLPPAGIPGTLPFAPFVSPWNCRGNSLPRLC